MEGHVLLSSGKSDEKRYAVLDEIETDLIFFDKPLGKFKDGVNLTQCVVILESIEEPMLIIKIICKDKTGKPLFMKIDGIDIGKKWLSLLQSTATQDSTVWTKTGWMTKKSKKRWFLFSEGELRWFAKEFPINVSSTELDNELKGKLEIGSQCSVSLYDAKKHAFVLTSTNPESQYILYAPNETVLNEWMQTLKETIEADDTSTNPHELKAWLRTKNHLKRYFVIMQDIDDGTYHLRWYSTTRGRGTVSNSDKCKGSVALAGCSVRLCAGRTRTKGVLSKSVGSATDGFIVETANGQQYEAYCKSKTEAEKWRASLQYCVAHSEKAEIIAGDDTINEINRKSTRRSRGSSALEGVTRVKNGWLNKNNKRRYAALDLEGRFSWYTEQPEILDTDKASQSLIMNQCTVSETPGNKFAFTVATTDSSKTWTFTASSIVEATSWLNALRAARRAVRQHSQREESTTTDNTPLPDMRRGTHSSRAPHRMSRAATMEMRGRLKHSLGSALFPARDGALFDNFLVVGLPPNTEVRSKEDAEKAFTPQVLYRYPPDKKIENEQAVTGFCFPRGIEVRLLNRTLSASARNEIVYSSLDKLEESESSFIILITGAKHLIYGVCVMKIELLNKRGSFLEPGSFPATKQSRLPFDPVAPQCFVFLSRFPFFQLHFEVLYGLLARERLFGITSDMLLGGGQTAAPADESLVKEVDNAKAEAKGEISKMLDAYYGLGVPPDGEPLSFQLPQELRSLQFCCPPGDEDNLVANACLGALFKLVSLKNILTLLGACTLEKQIVVVSENLGVLSAIVLALIPLMRPHVWQGAFIPIVPSDLLDALHCPVPYVMGVPVLDDQLKNELDVLILDVSNDKIILPSFKIPQLPRYKLLYEQLKPNYDKLHCKQMNENGTPSTKRNKATIHPFRNTKEELELVHAIWKQVRDYNIRINVAVDANIAELRQKPENLNKKFDFSEPNSVEALLKVIQPEYKDFLEEFLVTQNFLCALQGQNELMH